VLATHHCGREFEVEVVAGSVNFLIRRKEEKEEERFWRGRGFQGVAVGR
jgi:hypothetical protein